MAINIKFDLSGNPELPTIILANRNGNKLGQLKVNTDSINLSDKFNDASEMSFTVNKYFDDELTPLWDKLVDFKLIYCKEWDMWFEAKVELDEETESVKTVFCTQLGHAELSQIMLHNIEINTEKDIARDDYKISILYDAKDPKASILNRMLEKAPHYRIIHVDDTIKGMQRSFSFDGVSIHDAFIEISKEIGCLFVYHSNSDENGKIQRTISVYDLQRICLNPNCEYHQEHLRPYRGEFTYKCPKCNGTDIQQGYGDDTLIFVTSDELASSGIELVTDTDEVKNCFKLVAGDDLMTATIRNCNPNGTDYIWYISNSIKEDMSADLVEKLSAYNDHYRYYCNEHESNLNSSLVSSYNSLVYKYDDYYYDSTNRELQTISSTIVGYPPLMHAYYNAIDLGLYLESGLMPNVQMDDTSASEQANKLNYSSLSPVAVNTMNVDSISGTTADSAVLSMAKVIVSPIYRVEIVDSTYVGGVWDGTFRITNYSDKNDTITKHVEGVRVNNNTETFVKQKIQKMLSKENTEDLSISGLFEKSLSAFRAELKKYALNPLQSFYDACDACLSILIDQGAGDPVAKPDLYQNLYTDYYNKSTAIADEIKVRENELATVNGVWRENNDGERTLVTKGLKQYIEECRDVIHDALDFEKYLGTTLWLEFSSYRREDVYENNNYISDGLDNIQLFEKALEFIGVAENEIYKSSELQRSISTSLKNLLAIDKFQPLVNSFRVGNWIRVRIDDEVYRLRLLEYEIDFGNFNDISVKFSEVTKIKDGFSDIESVLSQASSMASSYGTLQRQAKQGDDAGGTIDQWLKQGLNSALVRIKNNNNEEVTLGKNGLLCRAYEDIEDSFSPEQFRLTHNIMAYTTDNWKTVSAALGKHDYSYFDNNNIKQSGTAYGLTSNFVQAGYISGSQIIGGEIYSDNYDPNTFVGTYMNLRNGQIRGGEIFSQNYNATSQTGTYLNLNAGQITGGEIFSQNYNATAKTGTYLNLNNGTFSWAGGKIQYDGTDLSLDGVGLVWDDIAVAIDNDKEDAEETIQGFIDVDYIKTLNLEVGNQITMGANATISWEKVDGAEENVVEITKDTINAPYIKSLKLEVGDEITMGANAKISWTNVTDTNGVATKSYVTDQGYQTASQVTTITKNTITTSYVNALGITAKTFSADTISGKTFDGSKFKGVSGSFTKLTAGSSSFTEELVKIDAGSKSKGCIQIGYLGSTYTDSNGQIWDDITIIAKPSKSQGSIPVGNIGTPQYYWDMLCIDNIMYHSDRNLKTDIFKMDEKQEEFFNLLSPVTYKFIYGNSKRRHYGYISQDVESALVKSGLTAKDFAGFCKDIKLNEDGSPALDENGNQEYIYSLRYSEFIALNTHMIQKLQAENKILKERIDSLEDMIKQLS